MLTIYRRHLDACENKAEGRSYRRCRCPLWVQGTLAGEVVRKSLDLSNWDSAQRLIRDWEASGKVGGQIVSVVDAVDKFIKECEVRQLSDATLGKLRVVLKKQLIPFADEMGHRFITQLGVEELRAFRATWKDSPISATKKLERLRGFFYFCKQSGWIKENPASVLKPPKVPPGQTLPFTEEEIGRMLMAVEQYPQRNSYGHDNRARIRAFILLLLHSGLRIRDAVCLRREYLKDGRLFLRTSKTGTPVNIPLPPDAVKALEGLENRNPEYFFWTGNGLEKSAVADFQRAFRRVMKTAGIKGHPHMMRDTMAVRLLNLGVSIETVAAILGHSVKVCEKHYAPWVKSRQDALDAAIKKTWVRELPDNVAQFPR